MRVLKQHEQFEFYNHFAHFMVFTFRKHFFPYKIENFHIFLHNAFQFLIIVHSINAHFKHL